MKAYDHIEIEKKWQDFWTQNKIYTTPDQVPGKDNFFLLVEFPYPSGNLHVGHWYAFAIPDIYARAMRMQGKNVLYPIGFDAFGLPAENAAIKNKLNPRQWTEQNIAYMTKQIQSMGTSFDWSRCVSTIDPKYYKWTQWLFLQLHQKGLVYQKETAVNWCPNDKTVLANEQVVDGKCERCGHEVVQRQMLQWNIKITDYADRLIDDLEGLDWPEQIKESQRNWIGRSEGAEIDFALDMGNDDSRFILLHGREGSSQSNFIPWLKAELEKRGHEVETPDLPGTNEPDDEAQTDYVEKHCTLDERTVIVGHSFGGIVALRLLERGHKVRRVVLAASVVSGKFNDGKVRASVTRACEKGFDFKKIKVNARAFIVLPDATDKVVPIEDAQMLTKELSAIYMLGTGNRAHFTGKTEPDILMACIPTIRVFTTRPDTLFGATYLVLAPEHPWITLALGHPGRTGKTVLKNNAEVQKYVDQANKKTELERQTDTKDKTGVRLEGVEAVNPATGEKIPLFVADYVLGHYGTGAIMAVPAHDERDFEFAKKFDMPIREVIEPTFASTEGFDAVKKGEPFVEKDSIIAIVKHWKEEKYLCLAWKKADWKGFVVGGIEKGESAEDAARREVIEETGYQNPTLVRALGGRIHDKFYHIIKKANTSAHFSAFLFQLENDEQVPLEAHESELHELVWLDKDKVANFVNSKDIQIAWQRALGIEVYTGDGVLANSGEFDGMPVSEAKKVMTEKFGRAKKTYRLRDWIVSRQRYWGVPIPIIHCEKCAAQPVPDEQLPVELPPVEDYLPEGSGKSPLAKVASFVNTTCPKCGGKAERETDTLDTFVDSSWYFNRYVDPHNDAEFASNDKQAAWMPIDLYSGGAEHTTMHLLYSRFWHKALYDCGLVKDPEPYTRRMNRSIILGPDGQKMSKSRGNVIDPDEVVERLGADTVRLYLSFIGPYNEVASYPWNPNGVVGVRRFLERTWRLAEKLSDVPNAALDTQLHKTIKKVSDDIPRLKFNTAISAMMMFVNEAEKVGLSKDQFGTFLRLLAPFAPHMTEELWQALGRNHSIHVEEWPRYDEALLVDDEVTYAIQIDGKTRGDVTLPKDVDKAAIEAAAREAVKTRLEGSEIARTIVVPGRLVNFVLKH